MKRNKELKYYFLKALTSRSEIYLNTGNNQRSIDDMRNAIKNAPDLYTGYDYTIRLANIILLGTNDYERAEKTIVDVLGKIKRTSDKKILASACNILAGIYRHKRELDKALDYYKRSINILEGLGEYEEVFVILRNIGGIYHLKGNYDTSMEYLKKALKYAVEFNNLREFHSINKGIALILIQTGKAEQAEKKLIKCNEYFKNIGLKREEADTLNFLGYIYKLNRDFKRSITHRKKMVSIFHNINDPYGLVNGYISLGNTYYEMNEYKKAIECFKRSYELSIRHKYKRHIGISCLNLALSYFGNERIETAMKYAKEGEKILSEIKDFSICYIYRIFGDYYLREKSAEKAFKYFEMAMSMAEQYKQKELFRRSYFGKVKSMIIINKENGIKELKNFIRYAEDNNFKEEHEDAKIFLEEIQKGK